MIPMLCFKYCLVLPQSVLWVGAYGSVKPLSVSSGFCPPQKTTPKFQFDLETVEK